MVEVYLCGRRVMLMLALLVRGSTTPAGELGMQI